MKKSSKTSEWLLRECETCQKQNWNYVIGNVLECILIALMIVAVLNSHWFQDTKIVEICEGTPHTIQDTEWLIKIGMLPGNWTTDTPTYNTSNVGNGEGGVLSD